MAEITLEQLAAAEQEMLDAKESGDAERKHEAGQAFADLRMAFKKQEEAAGRRNGLRAVVEDE